MKRLTGLALPAFAGVLVLAACAPAERPANYVDDKAPAAKVVGEAVSCIPITQIKTSRVRSDNTIDFEMSGGRVYRNTLPYKCSGLGFEEAFSYKTSISQLCSTDVINVLDKSGGNMRGSCGLGEFVPVEYVKDEAKAP